MKTKIDAAVVLGLMYGLVLSSAATELFDPSATSGSDFFWGGIALATTLIFIGCYNGIQEAARNGTSNVAHRRSGDGDSDTTREG